MEQFKNRIGVIILIIIILLFVVGGYILMKYMTTDTSSNTNEQTKQEEIADLRLDKTKDFIYYENEQAVLEELGISYVDVKFNFDSMSAVNNTLSQESNALKRTVKYTKDMDIELDENVNENEKGIYSLEYRDYNDYSNGSYVSLLIKNYKYDIVNGINATSVSSYVVDKNNATQVSNDTLLSASNLDMDQVKAKIKEKLEKSKIVNAQDFEIDIDSTVNNLATYALYYNKNNKLEIAFVVKTNKNSYVEVLELS